MARGRWAPSQRQVRRQALPALTFPVVSIPLMTHRYKTAQQVAEEMTSHHWTVPLSSMAAVIFSVCRYQK